MNGGGLRPALVRAGDGATCPRRRGAAFFGSVATPAARLPAGYADLTRPQATPASAAASCASLTGHRLPDRATPQAAPASVGRRLRGSHWPQATRISPATGCRISPATGCPDLGGRQAARVSLAAGRPSLTARAGCPSLTTHRPPRPRRPQATRISPAAGCRISPATGRPHLGGPQAARVSPPASCPGLTGRRLPRPHHPQAAPASAAAGYAGLTAAGRPGLAARKPRGPHRPYAATRAFAVVLPSGVIPSGVRRTCRPGWTGRSRRVRGSRSRCSPSGGRGGG